jgi:CRISPR system Cascade subunit CasA
MFNLIAAPLIRAVIKGDVKRLTLPEALAALMRDEVQGFPALRPHQVHAWHMFLAQLGAIALHRADEQDPPEDAVAWTGLLLDVTGGIEEPWSLVVEDLAKPAFLQPPVPEGALSVLKNAIPTPDALDVLITARNFDLKSSVMTTAEPDDWLFALVSLQTMEGFLGAGNYGIARMNGGFSARPFLGLAPVGGPGAHLRRDIRAMLAGRDKLADDYPFYDPDGIALVWLEPWDGKTSLRLDQLDPWFIEICRRIRFAPDGDGFAVLGAGTSVARIDAKALNGVTGDFWAPVNDAESKSFSLDARGFSYRVLCQLLFGDGARRFRLPPAMQAQPPEKDMTMVARGVTRGQGKTEGFHARAVPVRRSLARGLVSSEQRSTLGQIADLQQREIEQIARALRFACAVVAIGGSQDKPGKDDYAHADPFVRRLEAEADARFFDVLQDRMEQGEPAKAPWLRHLIEHAEKLLGQAIETIPCAVQHRWRARVRAPGAFYGALWKGALVNDRDMIFPKKEEADA